MKFGKYICAASLLTAALCTLGSCSDDDDSRLSEAVLASASSLTFKAENAAEQIITVYADADWVTEVPDWVTVNPSQGTGVMDVTVSVTANMRDGAVDNPRKEPLVFKGRTLASRAEVLIVQEGDKYRGVKNYKVAEVAALEDETVISVPAAVVVAVTGKGFVVSDEQPSHPIFVVNDTKVAVGDKISFKGVKSSDSHKLPTAIDCEAVKIVSSGAANYPTPKEITAATIDTYKSNVREYVTVTGFYNGTTVVVSDEAKYSVSIMDAPESLGLAALNGHNVTVTGYYAGLAEPVQYIMASAVEDKGTVETVYWSEDFEWLDPWAVAGNAGRTVETNNEGASAPQLPKCEAEGTTALAALEARGYQMLRICHESKKPGECIYLQQNYIKFGKTGYQAGIILPSIETIPEGKKVKFSFDWCPHRQGSGKIDPVNLIVIVKNGSSETTYEIPTHGWKDDHKLEWIRAEVDMSDVTVDKNTQITVKQTEWAVKTANRWYFDNLKFVEVK